MIAEKKFAQRVMLVLLEQSPIDLLVDAGFDILRQEQIQGLLNCLRADKPSPFAGKQLPLQLQFPETY